jgi:hypothetical protein
MKKKQAKVKKSKPTNVKNKATSRKSAAPRRDNVDACDVAVINATLDHDLPPSKGGVA